MNTYVHDLARNLETSRIEAANDATAKKRTTQTDWHEDMPLPVERRILNSANALVAKSNWTYNSRGQVLTQTQTDP